VNPSMGAWVRHPCLTQSREGQALTRSCYWQSLNITGFEKRPTTRFSKSKLPNDRLHSAGRSGYQALPGLCETGMSNTSLQGRIYGVSRQGLIPTPAGNGTALLSAGGCLEQPELPAQRAPSPYLIDQPAVSLLHSAVGPARPPATRCEHSPDAEHEHGQRRSRQNSKPKDPLSVRPAGWLCIYRRHQSVYLTAKT